MTRKIQEALATLDITLQDHLVMDHQTHFIRLILPAPFFLVAFKLL